MDNESDVDVRIMSEQRKGVYSDSVKERPIISTVEKVVGKTMPTPAKARKILRDWYYFQGVGGKGGIWSEAELKQFKSEFTKLSLIEACQVHNRPIGGILLKLAEYMAVDYSVKNRHKQTMTESDIDDLVKNSFTSTMYGLCVNTQRTPASVRDAFRQFYKNEANPVFKVNKKTSKDARVVIPPFLKDDFDKWVKSEGVKIYLEHIETEFRRLRKSVH